MQNLNKENFWNALLEKYPEAVELFCKWIDKYKAEVGWDKLFGNGVTQAQHDEENNLVGYETRAIKFHNIPFEMQNGILARFDIECYNGILTGIGSKVYEANRAGYIQGYDNLFADLQQLLNKQKR